MSLAWRTGPVFGKAGGQEVVNQRIGLGCLLGNGSDRPLEDVAFALGHGAIVGSKAEGTPTPRGSP